jgi:hypothetical protein
MSAAQNNLFPVWDVICELVDVMRRCDQEYVAQHGVAHCTDEEWDAALQRAESLIGGG